MNKENKNCKLPPHALPLLKQTCLCTGRLPKTLSEMNNCLWEAFNAGRDFQKVIDVVDATEEK